MTEKDTYYIERDGVYVWLSQNTEPLPTDRIIEIRKMLFADEGKVLVRDGEIVGSCVWFKDGEYTEIDEPIEEPIEEEIEGDAYVIDTSR